MRDLALRVHCLRGWEVVRSDLSLCPGLAPRALSPGAGAVSPRRKRLPPTKARRKIRRGVLREKKSHWWSTQPGWTVACVPPAADVCLHEGQKPGSQQLDRHLLNHHLRAHGVLLVHVFQGFLRSWKAENWQGFSNHFVERTRALILMRTLAQAVQGCPCSGWKGVVAFLPSSDAFWDPVGLGAFPGSLADPVHVMGTADPCGTRETGRWQIGDALLPFGVSYPCSNWLHQKVLLHRGQNVRYCSPSFSSSLSALHHPGFRGQ